MVTIENELLKLYKEDKLNSLNSFLLGTVLKKRNKKEQAKNILIEALNKYPLLWGAWIELNMILTKEDQSLIKDNLSDHWVKNFNVSAYYLQVQQEDDSITVNGELIKYFPDSVYILNQIGLA